jgi:hypothetical protein
MVARLFGYQATVLSRPMRTISARASERTMAQVSVERRRRGVDIKAAPEMNEQSAHDNVRASALDFLEKEGRAQGGTSYNNSGWT